MFVLKKSVYLDTHWPSCQFYSWLGRWCTWDYTIFDVIQEKARLRVIFSSTQPSSLKNCLVDLQLNLDNFILYIYDWTSESLFLISFLKWGGNILAPGIVTPCSSCVIGQLFQDFSSFYKFLYLVLSTCLLRFLVSFVENACHLKIFKWFLDFYVLKMPCDWGT